MRVETSKFEGSHGHGPRGRGLWMFELHIGHGHIAFSNARLMLQFNETYSTAKKLALKKAHELGGKYAVSLTVMP